MKYLKIVLFALNLLILLAGGTVLGIGLQFEPSKGHLLNLFVPDATPHVTSNSIAYSLLGLGVTVVAVGFFGCCFVLRKNQCILAYMCMLVALIVTELITAIVGGVMTFQILSGLEERLISKLADDYGHEPNSDPFSQSLDFAQYKFNCCGIHGYGDYNGTAWWRDGQISGTRRQVPLTCCVLKNTEKTNTGSPMSFVSRVFHKINTEEPWLHPKPKDEAACQVEDKEGHDGYRHKEGCLGKITSWLQSESFTLVILGMGMAGIQTFGIITSAFLCRTIRDMEVD
ncbi:CD151 antigen-like [Hylaeus anthracinus]|uniref:CD151 antigen-like n=1 Tax=Hylaeus volcanicus TaxID=313075 RepID=UPI0023B846F2|nr:CD151 antigen-like [Hylaeus volcanicus]XP_053978007.1 CD151 antigen-like [Hylaeus volcanicus]XP_054015641.1 CD151 antigen-like [Hylaeus anthracinus]XP_054015642.1 CD151 antigen-like [Hylaeus anthracinus]